MPDAEPSSVSPVTGELFGDIALIRIDNPPVNALGHAVRSGLMRAVLAAKENSAVKGIVITCAGRTFCAGADIKEFGKPRQPPSLADVIAAIEGVGKPFLAAVHGTTFGGGLELALACHIRIATADTKLGLPEVKLGLLPGAGGTQRLPRAIGPIRALQLIASGEPMNASEALADGLIHGIAEGDLAQAAVRMLGITVASGRWPALLRDRDDKLAPARADRAAFEAAAKVLLAKRRGQHAPAACVKAVTNALDLPFDDGLAAERAMFNELVAGSQSKSLRHIFFAEREALKVPGIGPDVKPHKIARVAVVGAGTMGSGIAMCFANVGVPVKLIDMAQEAVDRGRAIIERNYRNTAQRGGLSSEDVDKRLALISTATTLQAVADADLVVEAVFEDMELKRRLFASIDRVAKPGTVLATNTSTLDVNVIASATGRPGDVVGMHFFSPANVMRLLEVVRAAKTTPQTLATAMSVGRMIGKAAAVSGVCDGFIGNRMLAKRSTEAERLIMEGADPATVDAVVVGFGFPMGPFAMADLAGIDVEWRVRQARGASGGIIDSLYSAGRLGQKSGKGYFKYETGSRMPVPDPAVSDIITAARSASGLKPRTIEPAEILERMLYPMINEAARILDEGIAMRASDIDVVWVFGYGWPAWRGGPMHFADEVGLARVAERLDVYAKQTSDDTLAPSPLLKRLAAEGKTFASLGTKGATPGTA